MTVDVGRDLGLADHPDVDHQAAMPLGGDEVAAKAGLFPLGVKGDGKEKGQCRAPRWDRLGISASSLGEFAA